MSAQELLFELGTEELPPRTLLALSTALTEGVLKGIDAAGIPHGKVQGLATPRRLAVRVQRLRLRHDQQVPEWAGVAITRAAAATGPD